MTEDLDPQNRVSDGPAKDPLSNPNGPNQEVGSDSVPLEPTTVRLDDDTRAFLRAEAERLGIPESEVVRQGLIFWRGWLARERADEANADRDRGSRE